LLKLLQDTGIVKSTSFKQTEVKQEVTTIEKSIEKSETVKINKEELANSNSFYSPLVLSIASKEGVSFDELK
jgi:hypothetical protein